MKCEYGCGQEAKVFFKTVKKWCCSQFATQCSVVIKRSKEGLSKSYTTGKRKVIIPDQTIENGIRKCTITLRKNLQEKYSNLLFEDKPHVERRRILNEEQKNICAICGIEPIWNDKPLKLHYDHVNGDRKNNKRENSRLICPNCHSQTDTYCRSIKKVPLWRNW